MRYLEKGKGYDGEEHVELLRDWMESDGLSSYSLNPVCFIYPFMCIYI